MKYLSKYTLVLRYERNINGSVETIGYSGFIGNIIGAFRPTLENTKKFIFSNGNDWISQWVSFESSRNTPISSENIPISITINALIRIA